MAFDGFDAFLLSQKSRDIIGIHPIVQDWRQSPVVAVFKTTYQLKDAFDSY